MSTEEAPAPAPAPVPDEDTARLDWLESNQTALLRVVRNLRRPSTTGYGHDVWTEFLGWSLETRMDECATVREAIDAGRLVGSRSNDAAD